MRVKALSGVLILIVAIAAMTGILGMSNIGDELEDIAEIDIPLADVIATIKATQLEQEVSLEKMLRAAGVNDQKANLKALEKDVLERSGQIEAALRKAEEISAKMKNSARDGEAREEAQKVASALAKINAQAAEYRKALADLVATIDGGGPAEAAARTAEKEADDVARELQSFLKEVDQFTSSSAKHAEHTEHLAKNTLIGIFLLGSTFGAVFAFFIGRSITVPLTRMREVIAQAARDKDLTLRVPDVSKDEIGDTGRAFNGLMASFQEVLSSVSQTSETVAATAEEMAAASEQVASASQQQSESASAMASAVEEMTVSIGQITDHAHEAHTRADAAQSAALSGSEKIDKLLVDIRHVADAVRSSAGTIQVLDERSKEIQGIVGVISGIAEQTNLLALNAAIEAARAGESGRGFAVVADEVRKLAERSAQATKEIGALVTSIQQVTQQAVSEMSSEVQEVTAEGETANEVGQVLGSMRSSSERMAAVIHDVSAALKEQTVASTELARHVENIAQMTEENNAAVQETATAAATLSEHAARLQGMASQFRIA